MPFLSLSSFVRTDARLLEERYVVRLVESRSVRGLVRGTLAAHRGDCLVCWFGSLWFLPAILAARAGRRPVIVICGGYDVANLPEIGYGNMSKPVTRWLGRLVFRLATRVVAFSRSAEREARDFASVPARKLRMIYLGVPDIAGPDAVRLDKRPLVLVVGNIDSSTLQRKGLLTVAAVSRLLADVEFVIAGRAEPAALATLRSAAGPNVRLTGYLSDADLEELMGRAKVILQPSLHEGFGMAVAEAMLRGAVPVVSARFSLPEIVGDAGIVADPNDPRAVADAIRNALSSEPEAGQAARARILNRFPMERRRGELLELVEELCHPFVPSES